MKTSVPYLLYLYLSYYIWCHNSKYDYLFLFFVVAGNNNQALKQIFKSFTKHDVLFLNAPLETEAVAKHCGIVSRQKLLERTAKMMVS